MPSDEVEPRLRFGFVEMLFALTAAEIAIQRDMRRFAPLIGRAVHAGVATRKIAEIAINEIAVRAAPGDAAIDVLLGLNTMHKRAG